MFLGNSATNSLQFARRTYKLILLHFPMHILASPSIPVLKIIFYSNSSEIFCGGQFLTSHSSLESIIVYYGSTAPAPNEKVLRFIAFVVLTTVCLLHFFSARAGRKLNRALATLKILSLCIVAFAGCNLIMKNYKNGIHQPSWQGKAPSPSSPAIALYYVIFSFQGWENATFVGSSMITKFEPLSGQCYGS